MHQATKNREYQIGLAVPVRVHGLSDAESRLFALREASIADYTFDHFKSKKNEFDKIDGLHIFPLAKETEEELEQRLDFVRLLRTSVQLARDLSNRPGNDLTPEALAGADLLVIIAPGERFSAREVDAIRRWVDDELART